MCMMFNFIELGNMITETEEKRREVKKKEEEGENVVTQQALNPIT